MAKYSYEVGCFGTARILRDGSVWTLVTSEDRAPLIVDALNAYTPPVEPVPCPFCGGEAVAHKVWEHGWQVTCGECGASPFRRTNEKKAIEAWNRRVNEGGE